MPLEGRTTYYCHWKEELHIIATERKSYIVLATGRELQPLSARQQPRTRHEKASTAVSFLCVKSFSRRTSFFQTLLRDSRVLKTDDPRGALEMRVER